MIIRIDKFSKECRERPFRTIVLAMLVGVSMGIGLGLAIRSDYEKNKMQSQINSLKREIDLRKREVRILKKIFRRNLSLEERAVLDSLLLYDN